MSREVHVRFSESARVKFPRATQRRAPGPFSLLPDFCIKIAFLTSNSIFHARNFLHRWLIILMPIERTIQYFRVFAQQIEVMDQTVQSLSSAQM